MYVTATALYILVTTKTESGFTKFVRGCISLVIHGNGIKIYLTLVIYRSRQIDSKVLFL